MSETNKLFIKKLFTNKALLVTLFSLIVVGATLMVSTYTWFFKGGTLLTIEFQTGYVEMNVGLYEGIDFDHDGILDADTTKDFYQPVYELIPAPLGRANSTTVSGIQGESESLRLPDVTIEKIAPGAVYTYIFDVSSTGDLDAKVELLLTNISEKSTEGIESMVSTEVICDETSYGVHQLTDWEPSTDGPLSIASDIPISASGTAITLKFKFAETDSLQNSIYEGASFKLPNMSIKVYSVE